LTMEIGPGGAAQRLHRDDKNFHTDHSVDRRESGYRLGSETVMGFFVPGVDTTAKNGATRVIPGSHLWGMDRVPKVEETVDAELKVGESLVLLGSVYHGAGENSTVDQKRPMHSLLFCPGIMRTSVCLDFFESRSYPFSSLWFDGDLMKNGVGSLDGIDFGVIGKSLFDEYERGRTFLVS